MRVPRRRRPPSAGERRRRADSRTGRDGAGGGDGRPRHQRGAVRRRARRQYRTLRQRMLLGCGVTVVGVALLGIVGVSYVMRAIGGIDRYDGLGVDAADGGPENYLVVGSDSRATGADAAQRRAVDGQRSDTIMVVRIDPSTEAASVLALPRDLVVPISGTGERARINSAYNDGRQTLVDTIRDNFGIEVNHYVEIDFQGFRRLVDAVGGIELYLDTAIKDTHSGLFVEDHGCVTLDGEQALAYARSRHLQYMTPSGWSRPDPTADLGRIQRQQLFLRQALVTALDEARSNPLRFKDLLDIGSASVGIDAETDPMALVDRFQDFDPARLVTYSLPVVPRGDNATLALDEDLAEPVLALFRDEAEPSDDEDEDDEDDDGESAASVEPALVTITVLNGTRVPGQARDAATDLAAAGFRTGAPDDGPSHDRTTIYHHDGESHVAQRVAQSIAGPAVLEVDERFDVAPGEVVVVTGEDFRGVEREPGAGTDAEAADSSTTEPTRPPAVATTTPPTDYTIGQPPPGIDCG